MLNDPEGNDPVYQICEEVFSKKIIVLWAKHTDWKEIQAGGPEALSTGVST